MLKQNNNSQYLFSFVSNESLDQATLTNPKGEHIMRLATILAALKWTGLPPSLFECRQGPMMPHFTPQRGEKKCATALTSALLSDRLPEARVTTADVREKELTEREGT